MFSQTQKRLHVSCRMSVFKKFDSKTVEPTSYFTGKPAENLNKYISDFRPP